jgi:hypothetical protein
MTTNLTDPPRSDGVERTFRRRRWSLAAAAAAAAAVAIAVPAAFLIASGPDRSPNGDPAADASAPGFATEQPSGGGPTTGLGPAAGAHDLLASAGNGAPAIVPYLEGTRLVRPDGSTVGLPRVYDQFAVLGDRVLATYDDAGDRVLDVLTDAGELVRSERVETSFAVSGTGRLAAWATPQGELRTLWPGGDLSLGNQGGPVNVAAVTGNGPCEPGDDGCRVYVNNSDNRPPRSVAPDRSVSVVAPGAIQVEDVSGRLAAVQLSSSDLGSCSGVYDTRADHFLWKTCDNSLFRFSPDGKYLLASAPYLDGLGLGSLSVLDVRTGDPVVKFTIRGGFIAQQGWEDETHPLVVISGPDGWELLRLGTDGTRERLAGPVPPRSDPTFKQLTLPGNL